VHGIQINEDEALIAGGYNYELDHPYGG